MERERRIYYTDSFKFSFVMRLNESYKYRMIVSTVGHNRYEASCQYIHRHWKTENCEVEGDTITVFVKNHKLAPGRVFCRVEVTDKDGIDVDITSVDPDIMLTYDRLHTPSVPNVVEMQQSIDIIELNKKMRGVKEDIRDLREDLKDKVGFIDKERTKILLPNEGKVEAKPNHEEIKGQYPEMGIGTLIELSRFNIAEIGSRKYPIHLNGSLVRPLYNKDEVALMSDIEDTQKKIKKKLNKLEEKIEEGGKLDNETLEMLNSFINNAEWDPETLRLNFYHGKELVCWVDGSDFVKDGMVKKVHLEDRTLVITFNVEAGTEDINVPLDDIFNPDNYYNVEEIDNLLKDKVDRSELENYAKVEDVEKQIEEATKELVSDEKIGEIVEEKVGEKLDEKLEDYAKSEDVTEEINQATNDMATQSWVNEQEFLTEHQDLSEYAKSADVTEEISQATDDMATQSWVEEQNYLTQHQSLDGLAKSEDVTKEIEEAVNDMATQSWVNEQEFLTEHQSLDEYAKSEDVTKEIEEAIKDFPTNEELENEFEEKLAEYAKSADVTEEINQATNDMATQSWVEEQNYLTQHQDLSEYAKSADVTEEINQATNDMATQSWVNEQEFLTEHQSLDEYAKSADVTKEIEEATDDMATQSWVNEQEFLTEHQDLSDYATLTELNKKQDKLISGVNIKSINGASLVGGGDMLINYVDTSNFDETIKNYATKEEVKSQIANVKSEILGGAGEDYDTLKEIEKWIGEHGEVYEALVSTVGEKAAQSWVVEQLALKADKTQVAKDIETATNDMATQSWVKEQEFLTEHQDLSEYAKSADVTEEIGQATDDMATQSWVEEQNYLTQHQSLAEYAKSEDVTKEIEEATDDMATQSWVEEQNYLTQHQDLSEYAKSADVTEEINQATDDMATQSWVNEQEFLTEHQSLDEYAKSADVTKEIEEATDDMATQSWVNEQEFLTEHQDLSDYATLTELNKKQDKLVSGVNIKSINGASLVGGGDMVIDFVGSGDFNKTLEQYAKTEDVDSKIANVKSEIIGGAGEDYDTLKEIEKWIGEHGEVYEALVSTVGEKAAQSWVVEQLKSKLDSTEFNQYKESQQEVIQNVQSSLQSAVCFGEVGFDRLDNVQNLIQIPKYFLIEEVITDEDKINIISDDIVNGVNDRSFVFGDLKKPLTLKSKDNKIYVTNSETYLLTSKDGENYLTEHQDLSTYAKSADVTKEIETATNDMATQSWVTSQNYLTEHQDLSAYAKSADVTKEIAQATTDMATQSWVKGQNYLTEVPEEYAKTSDVNSKIANVKSEILGGAGQDYDTLKEIEEWIGEHGEVYQALVSTVGEKAAQSWVEGQLALKADKTQVAKDIETATNDMATQSWVTSQKYLTQHQDLSTYAKSADVTKEIAQATTDMATQSWVISQNYLTQHQDLSTYAKTADLNNYVAKKTGYDLSKNDFTDDLKQKLEETPRFQLVESREALEAIEPKDPNTFYYVAGESTEYASKDDVNSAIDDKIQELNLPTFWYGTQAQYDLITPKDNNTLYFIEEES